MKNFIFTSNEVSCKPTYRDPLSEKAHPYVQKPSNDACIEDLPVELLHMIFKELALKDLIAVRGVSRRWRTSKLSVDIPIARRKLLDLYLRLIDSRSFQMSRSHIVPHLQPFCRDTFVAGLARSTPEEFKIWILEWPALAVFTWIWPGLPPAYHEQTTAPNVTRFGQYNLLANSTVEQLQLVNVKQVRPKEWYPFNDGLSYESPIWSGAASGRKEMMAVVMPLAAKKDLTTGEMEIHDFVLLTDYCYNPMSAVLRRGSYGAADVGSPTDGWVEFLVHEFERQEAEVSAQ